MNDRACKYCITFILLLGLVVDGMAQKVNLEEYKKRYPGESKVLLQYKTDYVIRPVGDSLTVDISRYEEALCLDENAILQAGQTLTYSGFFQIKKLAAQTLVPVKSRYKALNVEEFDTSDYRSPSIFHDDLKKISFKFPKVQPGAITKLNYSHCLLEPRFLTPVYFNDDMPVESVEVSVTFPSYVNIGYRFFNYDSIKFDFTKEQKGENFIYRWKAKDIPKIKPESDAPDITYYASHLFLYIKDYTINGKNHRVLSTIDDLFNWYKTFIDGINHEPSPKLKLLTDSLVAGITDTDEKAKKLFYWVQDHIKYIAFEAGRDGFVPRDGELVYTRRYGDCKDMASITKKMLDLAGIKGCFVWLGTRHLPYKYTDLPLPANDNHMIAAYNNGKNWVFLDATTGPHPFGMPSYMIQSKEALIYLEPDKYDLVKIPEIEADKSLVADTLFLKLEDKKIVGRGVTHFRGYSRYEMYDLIGQETKTSQATILKRFFQKGNNKFLIDDFTIVNLNDRDKDLIISYKFNISDYAQVLGNEIFINLNLEKPEQMDLIKKERKISIENDFKREIINHVVLEIPAGFKMSYMPANSSFSNPLFDYRIEYKNMGNKVYLTRELNSNFLLLDKSQFEDWNKMTTQLQEAYKESINLTK